MRRSFSASAFSSFLMPVSFCSLTVLMFSVKNDSVTLIAVVLALTLVVCFGGSIYAIRKFDFIRKAYTQISGLSGNEKRFLSVISVLAMALLTKNSIFYNLRVIEELNVQEMLSNFLSINETYAAIIVFATALAVSLIAFPALYILLGSLLKFILPGLKEVLLSITRAEYIILGAFFCLIAIMSIINVFEAPVFLSNYSDGKPTYIGFFGADSSYLAFYDCLASPVLDDIRHPLMGIVSMPFSLLAWFFTLPIYGISLLMPFQGNIYMIFALSLTLVQALAVSIGAILLKKIIAELCGERFSLLFLLVFLCSFPALFYSITVERYAIMFFYNILFLFVVTRKKQLPVRLAAFICMVGSISTSVVFLPLLFDNIKQDRKRFFSQFATVAVAAATIIFFTGRLAMILDVFAFSGGFLEDFASFFNRENIFHMTVFLRTIFICPAWIFDGQQLSMAKIIGFGSLNSAIAVTVFVAGISALFIGFKKQFIRTSFFWAVFAALLLGVLGIGTVSNEMALYSLYFSWAFFVLVFYALYKILNKVPRLRNVLMLLFAASMISYNLYQWVQIICAV